MIEITGSNDPEKLPTANTVRKNLFEFLPQILNGPHEPELTQDEKDLVTDKLLWLVENEYRCSYWNSVAMFASTLRPGTANEPTKLSPLILKWAGRFKGVKYREQTAKAKHAANGRVIRKPGGL